MSTVLDYSLSLVTGPTNLPVSLVEAKKHCEVATSDTTHDTQIRGLIRTATELVERDSRQKLVCQTWDQKSDAWPGSNALLLRVGPVLSVSSVKYVDTDGNEQTWGAANYSVDTARGRPAIWQAYSVDWPSSSTRTIENAITARCVVGFGDAVTADATGDTLTPTSGRYTDGDIVQLSNYGGAVPAGLAANTTYYVVTAGSTIQLSATAGGAAIDITDTGTGTTVIDSPPWQAKQAILLLVSHWFESREPVAVGSRATPNPIALTYDSLIQSFRPGYYP
jgi:uncharacterized phiE125 gp8 family phage protein